MAWNKGYTPGRNDLDGDFTVQGSISGSGDFNVGGDVNVAGDLNVLGNSTIVSASNLVISDPVIGLGFGSGSGQTGSAGDRGLIFGISGNENQAILWDQTSGSFVVGKVGSAGPDQTAFDVVSYGHVKVAALSASSGLDAGGVTTLGDTQVDVTTVTSQLTASEGGYFAKNVGINTSSPQTNLDVSGSARLGGTESADNLLLTGSLYWQGLNSGSLAGSGSYLAIDTDSKLVLSQIGGIAVRSYTNPTDNRVITSVDADTINAEANLTFDGSTLTVIGDTSIQGDTTLGDANSDVATVTAQLTASQGAL